MCFQQKLDSHFSEAHSLLTLEMQAVRSSCWDLPPAASACAHGAAPASHPASGSPWTASAHALHIPASWVEPLECDAAAHGPGSPQLGAAVG